MKEIIDLIKKARFVFVCGNGGSAATAEHFTNDLFSCGIKAICINSNSSIMTMIANDFGYEFTFSKQIELYATKDDLLITISCSGTSKNVVNASIVAKWKGMNTYEFETFTNDRDYENLENQHLKFAHRIAKILRG